MFQPFSIYDIYLGLRFQIAVITAMNKKKKKDLLLKMIYDLKFTVFVYRGNT